MPRALKTQFLLTAIWSAVGLLSGLYYREFTKINDFDGPTQLAVSHTHFLTLGALAGMIFLALEKVFQLSASGTKYSVFLWTWNVGLAITGLMLTFKGSLQVLGNQLADSAALAGISGLGHITLTVGFIFLLLALRNRIAVDTPALVGARNS